MTSSNIRADDVFVEAIEIHDERLRREFIRSKCEGNAELEAEVSALFEGIKPVAGILEDPTDWLRRAVDQTKTTTVSGRRTSDCIGPYKLLQKLGEGGMGTVFMADQAEPIERRVALKLIRPGLDSREILARFEAERQALAMMDHPNIAKVLDAGSTEDGAPFFVMELVKGLPITRFCEEQRLPTDERLELFISVCHAVAHAHQKGIIHRDLKPSNILVAEYDHRPTPKIIDFGVSKATAQRLTKKTLFTQFGQLVGTLEYMSPEQAKFNQLDVDTRSDIYSLGVLLYELLSGSTPFDRERLRSGALDEILRIIREEEPPKPSTRLTSSASLPEVAASHSNSDPDRFLRLIRGDLDWIVMKSLAKERDDRYQNATELSVDIERYLNDLPIEARRPSIVSRARRFVRRHKLPVALSSLAILVAVTAVVLGAWATVAELKLLKAQQGEREARAQSGIAELHSHIARVAATSRNLHDTNPTLSLLLGIEAIELSRSKNDALLPVAHEALLNSVGTLSGRPLLKGLTSIPVSQMRNGVWWIAATSRWLVARVEPGGVRLWDLRSPDPLAAPIDLGERDERISEMKVSDDGRWLTTIGSRLLRWDLNSPSPDGSAVVLDDTHIGAERWWLNWDSAGHYVATIDRKGVIQLWNLDSQDNKMMFVETLPDFDVSDRADIYVSPDGRWLALRYKPRDSDRKILLRDTSDGDSSTRWRVIHDGGQPQLADISPDSKWLAIVNPQSWELIELSTHEVFEVDVSGWPRFSPDGRHLVAGDWLVGGVRRWDIEKAIKSGREYAPEFFPGHTDGVAEVAVNGNGQLMVSTGMVGDALVWNAEAVSTESSPMRLRHDAYRSRYNLATSPDGRWIAVGGQNARLWDMDVADPASSPLVLRGLEIDSHGCAVVSGDGRWIAAAKGTDAIQLWDTSVPDDRERYARRLDKRAGKTSSLAISPNGRWLAATFSESMPRIWDLDSPNLSPHDLQGPNPAVKPKSQAQVTHSLDAQVSDRSLYAGANDGTLLIWDLSDLSGLPQQLEAHDHPIVVLAISPDEHWLASASNDGLKLWDLRTSPPSHVALLDACTPFTVNISFDGGSSMLAASNETIVHAWDLTDDSPAATHRVLCEILPTRFGENTNVFRMAMSPDRSWLYTSRYNATAQLWRMGQNSLIPYGLNYAGGGPYARVSPNGRWLATVSRTGEAQLWDLDTNDPALSIRVIRRHEGPIWKVAFSDDSNWLVTFSGDGTARRWPLQINKLISWAKNTAGRDLTPDERNQFRLDNQIQEP